MRLIALTVAVSAVFLIGCQSGNDPQNPALPVHFPSIAFYGHFLRDLTVDDVQQINALVRERPDIVKRILWIETVAQDRVEVVTGWEPRPVNAHHTKFIAYKRDGKWRIDNKSIKQEQETVTNPNTVNEGTVLE